jgi:seryl-tRNA synthetase
MAEAMRSYVEEANRLNHERRATEAADIQRLEKARKSIDSLVAAIEDGGYSRPLMERLKALEADAEALEVKLAQAPLDVPDVLPNIADLHRRKVERLIEALDSADERTEAASALRTLINRIVLTPGPKRGEVRIELQGDLETVLRWAMRAEGARPQAASRFLGDELSVSVGTGPGMTGCRNRRRSS